jgi:DNA topoisomerase VI subunit B
MEQQLVTDSWLLVSTEGFRMQQAGREPALLVKELLQNSLDAAPATIDFRIEYNNSEQNVRVVCDDVGEGVEDFDKMRCVFWTSKTDSHLKRGRMGRGLKRC